jgi:hypothetical protein
MNEMIEQRPTRREVLPYNGIRANTQPLCPEFWNQATETWDYANLLTHAKNDDRTHRTLGLGARRTILKRERAYCRMAAARGLSPQGPSLN